jgi:hypothetical protein
MSDCGRLSDRMPPVALGRSAWTEEESSHLLECASCQQEWALIRISARLGSDVGAELDSTATGKAVLLRLARHQKMAERRKSWGLAVLTSAAAAAAIILAGRASPVPTPSAPAATVASIPLPELESLLPAELDAVLQTVDEPYVGGAANDWVASDPDDEELENGFETWEG